MIMHDDKILKNITECLPNFPEEVIKKWLLPFALKLGFPPPQQCYKFQKSDWYYKIGQKNIDFWSRTTWYQKDLLGSELINYLSEPSICNQIKGLIDSHVRGKTNQYSNLQDSEQRFKQAIDFISNNKVIPGFIIIGRLDNTTQLLDGSHRLSAYYHFLDKCKKNRENSLISDILNRANKVWFVE